MWKKDLLCILALFNTSIMFAEEIKIYAPVAQNVLVDENNYIRYSPINMFDYNSSTVYAVTYTTINKQQPLLEIYFAEPVRFDKMEIKAGYFDERYYSKNNRLKNLKIQIFNCSNIDYVKNIELNDKMIEQDLYNGNAIISTKIVLYINECFSGTKWDDLVISDLGFYLNGKKQNISFGKGKCVYGETYHDYKYDNLKRLIYEYSQYGHAGADEKHYKYENNKVFMAYVGMDDDPNNLNFKEISSIDEKEDGTEFFYVNGLIVSEKIVRKNSFYISQYLYDQNKRLIGIIRICENSNWGNKYIEYEYNEDNLLIKKIGYEDATIYTKRYD